MARQPRHALAARIISRIDQLAAFSTKPGMISRQYLSAEHKAASELLAHWMQELNLAVKFDALATLTGRLEGQARGAKTLLVGSHLYTGPRGSKFDGALGALIAIEALAEMKRLGRSPSCAVEILVLDNDADERFAQPAIGARGISGSLEAGSIDAIDSSGASLADALRLFGGDPDKANSVARRTSDPIGYIEIQLEQGPVLDKEGAGVGVVTTVGGSTRLSVEVLGRSGHNGAWPMQGRRDALTGAAEMILAVEQFARETASLVATVGRITVEDGGGTLVPGQVRFDVDIRSPLDGARRMGARDMERHFRSIARLRQLGVKLAEVHNEKAAACDQRLIRHLSGAIDSVGGQSIGLPTCAGDNALAISRLCPIGLMFVRSKRSSAQMVDDTVRMEDIETATRALIEVFGSVAQNGRTLA